MAVPVKMGWLDRIVNVQWGGGPPYFIVVAARQNINNVPFMQRMSKGSLGIGVGFNRQASVPSVLSTVPIVFPPSDEMIAAYKFWFVNRFTFPLDENSTDNWLINFSELGKEPAEFRITWNQPSLIPLGAALTAQFFTHHDFVLDPDSQVINVIPAPGAEGPVIEQDFDLNNSGGPEHPAPFQAVRLVIDPNTQTLELSGVG